MNRDELKYKQIIDAAISMIAHNGYHQVQVSQKEQSIYILKIKNIC